MKNSRRPSIPNQKRYSTPHTGNSQFSANSLNNELKSNLELIPDIDTLKKQLEELFQIDKTAMSQKEINDLYYEKAFVMPNAYQQFAFEIDIVISRARLNIDTSKEDISLVKTFSYPDAVYVRSNSRVNLAGKPVFYGAIDKVTALKEVGAQVGSIGYVGFWKVKCKRRTNVMPYLPAVLPDRNLFHAMARNQYQRLLQFVRVTGKDKSEELKTILDFVSEVFMRETYPYALSSYIANRVFHNVKDIDFAIYPSYQTQYNSCNLAFKTTFVDRYFESDRIFKIEVKRVGHNQDLDCDIIEVGDVHNDKISWRGHTREDEEYFLRN